MIDNGFKVTEGIGDVTVDNGNATIDRIDNNAMRLDDDYKPQQGKKNIIYSNEWMLREAIWVLAYAYYFSLFLTGLTAMGFYDP